MKKYPADPSPALYSYRREKAGKGYTIFEICSICAYYTELFRFCQSAFSIKLNVLICANRQRDGSAENRAKRLYFVFLGKYLQSFYCNSRKKRI